MLILNQGACEMSPASWFLALRSWQTKAVKIQNPPWLNLSSCLWGEFHRRRAEDHCCMDNSLTRLHHHKKINKWIKKITALGTSKKQQQQNIHAFGPNPWNKFCFGAGCGACVVWYLSRMHTRRNLIKIIYCLRPLFKLCQLGRFTSRCGARN